MSNTLHRLSALLLVLLLAACGAQPATQTPRSTEIVESSRAASAIGTTPVVVASTSTIAEPTVLATEPAAQQTAVPAEPTLPPTAVTSQPLATPAASPTRMPAAGEVVLQIGLGSAPGEVGLTAEAGPTTFRVAADGSLRILDPVNKRLSFYAQGTQGANGKLQKTIDLANLKQPSDFAVTTVGDVFVLDVEGWTLAMYSMDGVLRNVSPLHPSLKGLFSTISLTADGSLWGLGEDKHHILIFDEPNLPADVTADATYPGVVTVRSAAYFSVNPEQQSGGQLVLSISNPGEGTPIQYNLGQLDGKVTFLDINQGMEPYVMVQKGSVSEVRRYSIQGELLGTLTLDQPNCRPMHRSIYVDRPGDVFTMCVSDSGATITRYALTDAQGEALPLFDELVTTAPWSPASLQAAPG